MTNRTIKFSIFSCVLAVFTIAFVNSEPNVHAAFDAASVYAAKCAKCHGSDGSGTEKDKKKGVKDFTNAAWQKSRSDAQFMASINNGKGDVMPGWKAKLSAEEVKSLVGYVRSFAKK